MTDSETATHDVSELRNRYFRKFSIRALLFVPIALGAWALGWNGPLGAVLPVFTFVGGAGILAIDYVFAYRAEKRRMLG
ncbi:hypothetical protein [Brevibacterium metallidurans]